MKKVVKQSLGSDVSQKELAVCLVKLYSDWTREVCAHKTFANNEKGFAALLAWLKKLACPDVCVDFTMEATGVYHEKFAYFLKDRDMRVSIVLPNKIFNYAKTLDTKTVTDKTASEAIAVFGLERDLENWEKPLPIYKKLQQLSRERGQIMDEKTMVKNQLHAELAGVEPNKSSLARMKKRIAMLEKQDTEIKAEINGVVKTDEGLAATVLLLCSIPGVGVLTAAAVLAETNGFSLIRNRKQLVSYAGLDVVEKVSGTSVRGKSRISKRGNRHLRRAMHMPALAAIRHNPRHKALFERLVSKHGIKMKAVVAVQRKLLELMYTVYKTGKKYDKDFLQTQAANKEFAVAES